MCGGGGNLEPPVSFVALFFRMSFETCPKRISLAVTGRLLLTFSYCVKDDGDFRLVSAIFAVLHGGSNECPGWVTWRHR